MRIRHLPFVLFFLCLMGGLITPARSAEVLTVAPISVADEKAVFATVQSLNVVPARARIGGTVAALSIHPGDHVDRSAVLAVVGDEKIALQINALDSKIAGYDSETTRAKAELDRLKILTPQGAASRTALEQAQRNYDVAVNEQRATASSRDVLRKQITEGQVLAPVAGRVLNVPVTAGTVVMPGDTLAMIAQEDFILRLEVPERHAADIKLNAPIRLDGNEMAGTAPSNGQGQIIRVYPLVENGHVVADARVEGLQDFFVGQRVRVMIPSGTRSALVIPEKYVLARFGVDYVRLVAAEGKTMDVPIQRGQVSAAGVEILSGLQAGDKLVAP